MTTNESGASGGLLSTLRRYYEAARREAAILHKGRADDAVMTELAGLYRSLGMDLNQMMIQWRRRGESPSESVVLQGSRKRRGNETAENKDQDDSEVSAKRLKSQPTISSNVVDLQALVEKSLEMFGSDDDDDSSDEDAEKEDQENVKAVANEVVVYGSIMAESDAESEDELEHDLPFAEPVAKIVGRAFGEAELRDYQQEVRTIAQKLRNVRAKMIAQMLAEHLRWDKRPKLSNFHELSAKARVSILWQLEMMVNEWAGDDGRSSIPAPRPYLSYRGLRSLAPMVTVSGTQDFFHDVPHQTTGLHKEPVLMVPGDPLHIPTIGLDKELMEAIANRPGEELLALAGTALLGREQKDLSRMSLDMRRDNPLDTRDPLFVWNQTATIRSEIKKPLAQLIRNRRNYGNSLLVNRSVEKKSFSHYKMRFYFDYSSGSVTESVLRDTPYGPMIVTGCIAKDEVEYNRSGNLHVLNLATGGRMDLCGHTVPLNLIKTIAVLDDPAERTRGAAPHVVAKKAKLPWRPHPRGLEDFAHFRDPQSTALFYSTVTDVSFTNSGKYFISSGCDGNCMLWNSQNGSLLRIFVGNAFSVGSPGSSDSHGHVYNIPAWNNQSFIGTRRTASYTAGTFHTLEPVLTMECDEYNSVPELQPGAQLPARWPVVTPHVTRVITHQDYEHIFASGVTDGSVWLWDLRGSSVPLSKGNEATRKPFFAVPSSSNHNPAASSSKKPAFNISIEITRRRPDDVIRHTFDGQMVGNPRGSAASLLFGRKAYNHILVSFHDPAIRGKSKINFYDINNGKLMGFWDQFSKSTEASSLCISESGRLVGVGTVKDRHAYLVDIKSRSTVVQMFADQEDINTISISPCETFVACGSTVPEKSLYENLKVFDKRYPKKPLLQYDFAISDGSVDNDGITVIKWLQTSGTSPFGHNRVMLSGHSDGCVRFIDPTLGQSDAIVHGLDTVDGGITSLSLLDNHEVGKYRTAIRTDLDEILVPVNSRDPEPPQVLSPYDFVGDDHDEYGYRRSMLDFDDTVITCGTSSGKVYVFSQNPTSVAGLQELANV